MADEDGADKKPRRERPVSLPSAASAGSVVISVGPRERAGDASGRFTPEPDLGSAHGHARSSSVAGTASRTSFGAEDPGGALTETLSFYGPSISRTNSISSVGGRRISLSGARASVDGPPSIRRQSSSRSGDAVEQLRADADVTSASDSGHGLGRFSPVKAPFRVLSPPPRQSTPLYRGSGDDEDHQTFVPQRSGTSGIRPPSAFFAPRKPNQRPSASNLLALASEGTGASLARRGSTGAESKVSSENADDRGLSSPILHQSEDGGAIMLKSFPQESVDESGHAASSSPFNTVRSSEFAIQTLTAKTKASREPLLEAGLARSDGGNNSPTNRSPRAAASVLRSPPQAKLHSSSSLKRAEQVQHPLHNGTAVAVAPKQSNASSAKPKERNYESFPGYNRFFLGGRLMTSRSNPWPFLGSLALIIALPTLFFVNEAPYIWKHLSPAAVIFFAYVYASAFVNMLVTAWMDPGVLPRDIDPDPPCSIGESNALDPEDPLAVPLPRIVTVREKEVKTKWCETCCIYRPPRSSHCRMCDNCVENIDHHCTYVNTCIGRRNYVPFFAFISFSILACIMAVSYSAVHLAWLTWDENKPLPGGGFGGGKTGAEAVRASPISVVVAILSGAALVPLVTLLGYHVRLVLLNRTTVEQIRINTTRSYGEKEDGVQPEDDEARACIRVLQGIGHGNRRDPNPFSTRSIWRNAALVLGRPVSNSWIQSSREKLVDQRPVNPGSVA